jgi:DNA invertase Pin-like site-specific DNA recombinase
MRYGYARVSTDGQSVDAQVRQLRAAGARQVFHETASGAKCILSVQPKRVNGESVPR